MGLFGNNNQKASGKKQESANTSNSAKKKAPRPGKAGAGDDSYKVPEATLKAVTEEFNLDDNNNPLPWDVRMFAKYYISNGGNGTQAYLSVRKNNITRGAAAAGANRMLRKLREHPEFWDMLGLGYGNLKEVVDELKKSRPEKAADIIMKVNKEDTERIDGNITVTIAGELSRDFK